MFEIEFRDETLYYNRFPLSLYVVLGLFKMFNYAYNPSVWSSGLEETSVDFNVFYKVNLIHDNRIYEFGTEDLFSIRDWLQENNIEWYKSLPTITNNIEKISLVELQTENLNEF